MQDTMSWGSCPAPCPHSPPHQPPQVGSPSQPSWLRKLPRSCELWGLGGHFSKRLPQPATVVVGGAAGTEQPPPLPACAPSAEQQVPAPAPALGLPPKELCATGLRTAREKGHLGKGKSEGGPLPSLAARMPFHPPSGRQAALSPCLALLQLHSWHSRERPRPSPSLRGRGRAGWGRGMGHTQLALGALTKLSLDLHVF